MMLGDSYESHRQLYMDLIADATKEIKTTSKKRIYGEPLKCCICNNSNATLRKMETGKYVCTKCLASVKSLREKGKL